MCKSVFTLRDPVNLKISIIRNTQLVVSDFIERTVLLAGIHLYHAIKSKNINCFIGYYFYMYPNMVYNMAAHTYDFFANLCHFQGIIICLYDNKRQ